MSTTQKTPEHDMNPAAVIAEATAARGDIFPEWKVLAHASPQTYHLVTRTGGYFHKYLGEGSDEQQLSVQMRELIATPALCSKNDFRHSPNHVRRMYRMGMTNAVIMEGAVAFSIASGWATIANVGYAIMEATNPAYPFGELPAGGEPHELTPFPELAQGRRRAASSGSESKLATPEWRYAAGVDPEFAQRAAAWADHCLLADGVREELLGPGPRELIVIAALCTRGEADLATQHILRAYDYGMTRRQVLEAISSIVPMTGMISAELGLRAMQAAEKGRKGSTGRKSGARKRRTS